MGFHRSTRSLCLMLGICLTFLTTSANVFADATKKGGAGPFLASCCIGPRVGLELNEGKPIKGTEWARAFGAFVPYVGGIIVLVAVVMQGSKTGLDGVLAECCIGPRVGEQLDERKIRGIEWASAIPVIGLIPIVMISADAARGRTMLEIEQNENLKRSPDSPKLINE